MIIESPMRTRYKRAYDSTTIIDHVGNFDARNYVMLPNCEKKSAMLTSLYDYYISKNPGYYDGIQFISINNSRMQSINLDTTDVYYGNDIYQNYYEPNAKRICNNDQKNNNTDAIEIIENDAIKNSDAKINIKDDINITSSQPPYKFTNRLMQGSNLRNPATDQFIQKSNLKI